MGKDSPLVVGDMRLKTFLVSLLFSIIGFNSATWAQTTGSIWGTVTDPDGQAVPGATVAINSDALIGGVRTAFTNELGVFRFPSLPIGNYRVEAKLEGFETVHLKNVRVGLDTSANVTLTTRAAIKEEISVVGEAPLIDVTQSAFKTTFTNKMVTDLPTQSRGAEWLLSG